ncbi:hypothetical protein TNCV_3551901 [Trichonephila clavipes]|nr:hypothetical protein TNCV_3551901 [Trichonephila clavipes]
MPSQCLIRPYRQLNDFPRSHIVRMPEAEWSYRATGHQLQRTDTAVQSLFQIPVVPSTISRSLVESVYAHIGL